MGISFYVSKRYITGFSVATVIVAPAASSVSAGGVFSVMDVGVQAVASNVPLLAGVVAPLMVTWEPGSTRGKVPAVMVSTFDAMAICALVVTPPPRVIEA